MRSIITILKHNNIFKLTKNRSLIASLPKFFFTDKKDTPSSSGSTQTPKSEQGSSSQSGGTSAQQSYTQDPQSTAQYMKTQFVEGSHKDINLLVMEDHNVIRTVYDRFKSVNSKEEAEKWRNELVFEIAKHTIAEELILYPLIRSHVPKGEEIYQQSIEEHRQVKENLYKAEHEDAYSVDFKQKVKAVMDIFIKHIENEEKEVLPLLDQYLNKDQRVIAGNQFSRRKLIVPTRAHTAIPESPSTLSSLLGMLTAPIDKFRDLFNPFPDQNKMSEIKKEAYSKATESTDTKDTKH